MSLFPNPNNIRFEPKLPVKYESGEPEQAEFSWANVPRIQMGTDSNWWGNAITDDKVGSIYHEYSNEPIVADGKFLARKASLAVESVQYLKKKKIASKITAQAFNPQADDVEVDLTIVELLNPDSETIITVGDYRKADPVPVIIDNVQDVNAGVGIDNIQNVNAGVGIDNIQDVNYGG